MSRGCGMLVPFCGFMEKIIKKKSYEEKLLQSIIFLRKKLQS
jgi:hypothetical protein